MKPEPETREAQLRKLEEKRARDFDTFLRSLERRPYLKEELDGCL